MWYGLNFASRRSLVILVSAISVVSYFFLNDPSTARIGIPCLIRESTGWSCWGCGGQRAFHQLMHGNIEAALKFNALVFPATILFAYILFAELTEKPLAYQLLRRRAVQISVAAFILIFTILRNLI